MPTPTALHAAVFGVGAAVGILGAGIWSRKKEQTQVAVPVKIPPPAPITTVTAKPGALLVDLSPSDVLRFGHPGT